MVHIIKFFDNLRKELTSLMRDNLIYNREIPRRFSYGGVNFRRYFGDYNKDQYFYFGNIRIYIDFYQKNDEDYFLRITVNEFSGKSYAIEKHTDLWKIPYKDFIPFLKEFKRLPSKIKEDIVIEWIKEFAEKNKGFSFSNGEIKSVKENHSISSSFHYGAYGNKEQEIKINLSLFPESKIECRVTFNPNMHPIISFHSIKNGKNYYQYDKKFTDVFFEHITLS